jgi:hypothetical protein
MGTPILSTHSDISLSEFPYEKSNRNHLIYFLSKKDLKICQSGKKTGVLTEGLVGDAV